MDLVHEDRWDKLRVGTCLDVHGRKRLHELNVAMRGSLKA